MEVHSQDLNLIFEHGVYIPGQDTQYDKRTWKFISGMIFNLIYKYGGRILNSIFEHENTFPVVVTCRNGFGRDAQ